MGKKNNPPDILHCFCGGIVKLFLVYRKGKLVNEFRCLSCGRVENRFEKLKEGI
jgi:hypothetical protein